MHPDKQGVNNSPWDNSINNCSENGLLLITVSLMNILSYWASEGES